ncbi:MULTISPECIES: hypothetical protein [unclassified Sphingobium]|uniref:hypothetical protein n=1 Tax=unclassified Sphingobium TaxID=2611147 RepID=UPI0035A6246F
MRLSTGLNFSTGDYGDTRDTKVYAAPVAVTYKRGGLKLRVSVPWVRVEGPASLLQTPEGRDKTNNGAKSEGSGGASGSHGGGSSGSDVEVEDEDDGALIDDKGGLDNGGGDGSDDNGADDDGNGGSAGSTGGNTTGGTTSVGTIASAMQRRSGLGDVNVAATYSFDLGGDFYFEPTARVKLPTASRQKRLGTKKVDVTVSADLVKDIGKFSFYLHGRRKFAGKPEGSTIRSTWGAGGGFSLSAAKGISLGADYDWQQSTFAGRTASSEITSWASIRLSPRWNMTAYGLVGTNQNSARYGAGISISYRLF